MSYESGKGRYFTLQLIVVALFLLLGGRVFYLQVMDHRYSSLSANNVLRSEVVYPARGEVYDRNGEYLVQSRGCYDMMVIYRELPKEGFDTMKMCDVVGISKEQMIRALNNARLRPRIPSLVANFVTVKDKLRFDELNMPAFHSVYRTVRQYPRKIGGNLLGHVGEISEEQLARWPSYRAGDYIGDRKSVV